MMYLIVITLLSAVFQLISGHGRLMDPPARNSMWRLGFNNPVNWNDNELYCGGKMDHVVSVTDPWLREQEYLERTTEQGRAPAPSPPSWPQTVLRTTQQYYALFNTDKIQWVRNKGKCGVCGDPYHGARQHELGGKYANNIITRSYKQGDDMPVTIHLTANHRGWFEFKICPVTDEKKEVTQECLDQRPLTRKDDNGTKFYVPKGKSNALFNYTLKLPDDLVCDRCVVQWLYRAGNTWDKDDKSGTFCLGCGPQEEFYNCADISVSKNDNIEDSKETIPTNKPVKVDSPSDNKGTKAPNVIRYTEKVKSPPATSKISPSRNVKATSTTQLVNTPTEQVLVLKIPHSVQNEIGTIPTVKQGVSMALEKLKLENMWKSTIDIITEGSTKSIGKTEQAKAKDGELFRGMKWWTASPVAKETTTFPWTYATKPTTTAITVQADNKQIVKPGRRPDSLSPFANSWAWQYSWIKSNFIFDDDHRKANRTNSNDIIKEIFSTKPKPKASSTTVSTDDFVSAYGNLHATPTPVVTRKSKNSPSQRSKTPNWLKTSLHPSLPGDLSYLVTRSGRDDDGNEYKSFESEPDEVADLIYEFIDGKRRGYPEDESQQYVSVEAEIQHHNHPDTEEADIHHNHNHPKSDIKTIYRGPYRCPPTQKAPPTNNWQDGSSYKNKPTNPRDQNRYWSPPVYQTWPSTRRTLNCRARIRFSGGMDEWCDINCNANFCPPSFCICEKIFDKSQYETAYPQPIRESWNAYKKPMHVKRLPWEHQYIEKTQQKSWTYKRPEASVFSKGVGSFLSKKYNRIGHDQKVNIRENIVETNFPEVKTKRKRKICVAIGRYSGQSQYDNWCELNCSARFCPPLFCKCYLSY